MPAKGGNGSLSDDEVKLQLITWLISLVLNSKI